MYYGMKSCYKVTVMYRHRCLLYLTISAITFFSADFANFMIDNNLLLLLLLLLSLLLLLYIILFYIIITVIRTPEFHSILINRNN